MNKITVTTEKKTQEVMELTTPCFFRTKDEREFLAILDDKTMITLYKNGDLIMLKNCSPTLFTAQGEISNAYHTWSGCSEAEFMDAYESTIESLMPKMMA